MLEFLVGVYLISYINVVNFMIQYKETEYKTWDDFFSINKTKCSTILIFILLVIFVPYFVVGLSYVLMKIEIIKLKKRGG